MSGSTCGIQVILQRRSKFTARQQPKGPSPLSRVRTELDVGPSVGLNTRTRHVPAYRGARGRPPPASRYAQRYRYISLDIPMRLKRLLGILGIVLPSW